MTTKNIFGRKEEIFGSQTLWRELGYYISQLECYEKSLKYFDEAIKKTPNDKRALIGRSRARAKACQYEGALEDINRALRLDPSDFIALAEKALNTYLSCEFEEGLVQNTRCCPMREKPDHFYMGVMHCTDAIENCIGERAGKPLRDYYRIIRRIAWKQNYEAQESIEPKPTKMRKSISKKQKDLKKNKQEQPVIAVASKRNGQSRTLLDTTQMSVVDSLHSKRSDLNFIPPLSTPFPFTPLQKYTSNIKNYMSEKYLGAMYLDKIFLKKLQTDPGVTCPNQKGSEKIKHLAKTTFKAVSYKQELLRTRRPFYFIKYEEAVSSGDLKTRQQEELNIQQENIKNEAENIVKKLQDAYEEKNIRVLLDIVEKLKSFCDSKSKRLFPDKNDYLQEIYDKVCKGFYELNRLNPNQALWDQEKRIYLAFGFPLSVEPSADSVIGQFKNVVTDHKKYIKIFERRLKLAEIAEEICWCYHELSRHQLEMKRFELAKVYGEKCVQESKLNEQLKWTINGQILLMRTNIQQRNKNDAKNNIESAMEVASQMKDLPLQKYLERCLSVVENLEFDDLSGPKVLAKRERDIVSLLTCAKMKDEASHLFRMMASLPPTRRMTIMPGIRGPQDEEEDKTKRSVAWRQTLGSISKNIRTTTSKGDDFLQLVEHHLL